MATVSVNPPKTPITAGSSGIAQATTPNTCKMPGPPAPFVPTPLPNIAKSGSSPDGYSTSVEVEGNPVCIFGGSFQSNGDEASKGTGGGLLSSNTAGPVKFIAPGSMTVKIEGKTVHLLGDSCLNNCGPGGAPPNTGATMSGTKQADSQTDEKENLECGEVGTYAELKKKAAQPVDMERDHIPSKASLFARAKKLADDMTDTQEGCVNGKLEANGLAVAIPRSAHRGFSPTCGSKNTTAQIAKDAKSSDSMKAAAKRDTDAMQKHLNATNKKCAKAYAKAAKEIKENNNDSMIKKALADCGVS
jgi:hypothetical protein